MLKPGFHIQILLICFLLSFPAFASGESTYLNKEYSFSVGYPKNLKMRDFGGGYFDILKDGKILLEASVEDDTFEIFIHDMRPQKDKFRDFARQRCRIICDADGPDGSSYCKEIEREREWVSRNGLRVMEFILIFTREDYQDRSKEESRIGPVYVVDISRADRPLALMIDPGHGILASDSTQGLIRKIVDSVKLVP